MEVGKVRAEMNALFNEKKEITKGLSDKLDSISEALARKDATGKKIVTLSSDDQNSTPLSLLLRLYTMMIVKLKREM